MSPAVKEILQHVASWPQADQEELAEAAREIEARRTGVYVLTDEERAAIADARSGELLRIGTLRHSGSATPLSRMID